MREDKAAIVVAHGLLGWPIGLFLAGGESNKAIGAGDAQH